MTLDNSSVDQVDKMVRQQKSLAAFGTFAFGEVKLQLVLDEAARICADCLDVPFSKICQYRPFQNDLLVVAGQGWRDGVVGFASSDADETSPQGLAFKTGKPQICPNIDEANIYNLPSFYPTHKILSTVDVIVAAKTGPPFGVLEVDSQASKAFDEHDIDFLTGFANILAEAVATATRSKALQDTIGKMQQLIEEKDTLSQELKHRVRNSLHLVYSLLTAELDKEHTELGAAAFKAIALRVMTLSDVFDHLLGTGMSREINLGNYIHSLCVSLPELYNDQARVKLTSTVEPVFVDLDVATALGTIMTEMVANAYGHAFPSGAGNIAVRLGAESGHGLLIVSDDGVGFDKAIDNKRRGMRLIHRLVQQVGGTISIESNNGTTAAIAFASIEARPALSPSIGAAGPK